MEIPARQHYQNYALNGFDKVQGWCSKPLLQFLSLIDNFQSLNGVRGAVGEIGVQDGKLFIALHNLLREGERSLAIDVFEDYHLNVDKSGHAKRDTFKENITKYCASPELCDQLQSDSMDIGFYEISNIIRTYGKFRLFSVDGSHTTDHTIHDIFIAENLICNGGVVLVDDYYNPYWPEVHQAVAHLMINKRMKLVPLFYQCGKLFFTTAAFADNYKKLLVEYFRGKNKNEPIKICTMYGYSIILLTNYK
jgi:hypothetical protein